MITIIDYMAGNLKSVERALLHLGVHCRITHDPHEIVSAERVIFPGVGAAGQAMDTIRSTGLDKAIHAVVNRGTPFMGICLGTQIILEESEEDAITPCLGIIPGKVRRFSASGLKIPHMGWNHIAVRFDHPLLDEVDSQAQFYFVHSFYPDPRNATDIVATTEYGITFASILARKNVFATQFHPEKSGRQGLKILENFSCWDGLV
jgi:glutamine amidotransferase